MLIPADWPVNAADGFVYESFVLAALVIMTLLALARYFQKGKNPVTFLLFVLFLFWTIAVMFSWLAKYFTAFLNLNPTIVNFSTLLIRWVLDFRLLFVFVAVALYVSYVLRVKLFDGKYNMGERVVITAFLIVTPVLSLALEQKGNMIYTVIVFLVEFIYMLIVYGLFMKRALDARKHAAEPRFKAAFSSLAVMSLFFILAFLNFLLDQVWLAITGVGYTVFYFAAWSCAVVGVVLAYLGYIKPRA
jgi:hypothetical protein